MLLKLKLFFIIIIALLSLIIIGAVSSQKDVVDFDTLEMTEMEHLIIQCFVRDGVFQEERFHEDTLNTCLPGLEYYGAKIRYQDTILSYHLDFYQVHEHLCSRTVKCHTLSYTDIQGHVLTLNSVIRRTV